MQRAYTQNQINDMEFPVSDYDFPEDEGDFTGTLIMKKWSKNQGIICYFVTDCGKRLKICVWNHRLPERKYRPRESNVDISHLPLGSKLEVEYTLSKKGKTEWNDVDIIYLPSVEEEIEYATKENEKY